jgi:hypothetical protein
MSDLRQSGRGGHLLPFGTPADIEADVKAKIEMLGRGGG